MKTIKTILGWPCRILVIVLLASCVIACDIDRPQACSPLFSEIYYIEGSVTNQQNEPLSAVKVGFTMEYEDFSPIVYTDSLGLFELEWGVRTGWADTMSVAISDTTGVYQSAYLKIAEEDMTLLEVVGCPGEGSYTRYGVKINVQLEMNNN